MEPEGSLPHSQQPSIYPYPQPQQSSTCPMSILILSSHLSLGLPSALFLSRFPIKTLFPTLLPTCAVCPAHLILTDFITRTIFGEQYISLSSSLCSFLNSPVASPLLGPNILLSTLFSNTLSLRPSNVSDQVSHPYKTRDKTTFLYLTADHPSIRN